MHSVSSMAMSSINLNASGTAAKNSMRIGALDFVPVTEQLDLVAAPVAAMLSKIDASKVFVSAIDPELADTAAFCEQYQVGLDISANCVVLEAKRADRSWYVACMVLATNRADVNGVIRRHLDARKISFASMDAAVSLSGMAYGGITPVGLPQDWPILVDAAVANTQWAIVGSGIRGSKLLMPGNVLTTLPGAEVLSIVRAPELST
jgi:prolyl-tRNA editing enzyme YbaK/EbsC (Cys-tRNA(Pro) deacylase)